MEKELRFTFISYFYFIFFFIFPYVKGFSFLKEYDKTQMDFILLLKENLLIIKIQNEKKDIQIKNE